MTQTQLAQLSRYATRRGAHESVHNTISEALAGDAEAIAWCEKHYALIEKNAPGELEKYEE